MRVLLIQPSCIVSEEWSERIPPFLPLGLGAIAATVRDNGHEVQILDTLTEGWDLRWRIDGNWIEIGMSEEDVAAEIRRYKPQVVGFSVSFTTQMPRLRSLARWVKAIHPEIMVVVGGSHASNAPREVMSIPEIDLVVLGEGEVTFSRILDRLQIGGRYDNIDGIAFPDPNGGIAIRPPIRYIGTLDHVPSPAYDLLPLKKYFKAMGKRALPVFDSRGCHFKCADCTGPQTHGNKIRRISIERLLSDLTFLVEDYGVREFYFDDHNFFTDTMRASMFLDQLMAQDLKIQWTAKCGVDPVAFSEDMLNKMKLAGAKRIHFTPESGSRKVLRQILNKPSDPYILEQSVRRALSAGLKVSCQFTLGNPGETNDEIYDTLNYAWKLKSLGVDRFEFSLAVPYSGTTVRRIAENMQCTMPQKEEAYSPIDGCISTEELPAGELKLIRETAQKEFSSGGLVGGFTQRVVPRRRPVVVQEDRYFATVAPHPPAYQQLRISRTQPRYAEETT